MGDLHTRRYTLVHDFCFSCVGKGLMCVSLFYLSSHRTLEQSSHFRGEGRHLCVVTNLSFFSVLLYAVATEGEESVQHAVPHEGWVSCQASQHLTITLSYSSKCLWPNISF